MITRFYSEIPELKGVAFKTEQECKAAEEAVAKQKAEKEAALEKERVAKQKMQEQRSARAKEVEEAYKTAKEANERANALMEQFIADYGSFHMTLKGTPGQKLGVNSKYFWSDFLKLIQQI